MSTRFSLKFLKHLSLKRDGRLLGFGTGPDADWRVIFSSFALILIIVFVAGLYLFIGVDRGTVFTVPPPSTDVVPSLNTTLLDRVITYYHDRSTELMKIVSSREVIVDPSR